MRTSFFAFLSSISLLSEVNWAAETPAQCLAQHFTEAIALNHARFLPYLKATSGWSLPISSLLIAAENLHLPRARKLDADASYAEAHGVHVICDALESMEKTPAFVANTGLKHDLSMYKTFDYTELKKKLTDLIEARRFEEVVAAATEQIELFSGTPHFNCMSRHLLESIRRIAFQARRHHQNSLQLGLPSTLSISSDLLKLHLSGFFGAQKIDDLTASIQANGTPILCNDVPPIPLE